MTETINIIEIPGLIQNRTFKKVIFEKEGLTIKKTMGFVPDVFLPAQNIAGFRYGVRGLKGYMFNIGRQYVIELLDTENKIVAIKLNSFYRVRNEAYFKNWSAIINQLWDNYFVNNLNYYYDMYSIRQAFELSNVRFTAAGITCGKTAFCWHEIAISNYRTYFMIHDKTDLKKTRRCSFMNDWNALILQDLLKRIIKENNG